METKKDASRIAWTLRETDALIAQHYEDSEGEETAEIRELELLRGHTEESLLEALASFHQREAEKARIAESIAAAKRRKDWAQDQIRNIVGDASRTRAGAFEIKTRAGSQSVRIAKDTAPGDLPFLYQRHKTTIEPDKKKIAAAIKDGETITGCSLVRGPRSVTIA